MDQIQIHGEPGSLAGGRRRRIPPPQKSKQEVLKDARMGDKLRFVFSTQTLANDGGLTLLEAIMYFLDAENDLYRVVGDELDLLVQTVRDRSWASNSDYISATVTLLPAYTPQSFDRIVAHFLRVEEIFKQ